MHLSAEISSSILLQYEGIMTLNCLFSSHYLKEVNFKVANGGLEDNGGRGGSHI